MTTPTSTLSNVTFDPNLPIVKATHNTVSLAYIDGNPIKVSSAKSQCESNSPDSCSCCPGESSGSPPFPNECPAGKDLLYAYVSPPQPVGDTFPCGGGISGQGYCTYCESKQDQYCGTLDTKGSCLVGTSGYGECNSGLCTQHTDWDYYPTGTNPNYFCNGCLVEQNIGWINCKYNFSFDNFSLQININTFTEWLKDIYNTPISIPNVNGCTFTNPLDPNSKPIQNRIRDSNVIYCAIIEFFNEIYSTGYYAGSSNNPFNDIDYFATGSSGISSNIYQLLFNDFSSLYDTKTANLIQSQLDTLLLIPYGLQNEDTYSIQMYLSYTQYQDLKNNSNSMNEIISQYMASFLQESQGSINRTNSGQVGGQPASAQFTNIAFGNINAIQVINITNPSIENDYAINQFSENDWNNQTTDNGFMFGTIEVTADISLWSPMLVVFFANQQNITFSPNACKMIGTTNNQQPIMSIPKSCLVNDCTNNDVTNCLSDLKTYCNVYYENNAPFNSDAINQMVNNNDLECLCYTSRLVPEDVSPKDGNFTAMCFDQSCSNSTLLKNVFGISDATCASTCPTISDWINSSSQTGQPADQSQLDNNAVKRICGVIIDPYVPKTINTSVLLVGLTLTFLLCALSFSIGKHKNYSNFSIVMIMIVVGIVFLGISIFFAKDLAGIGMCETSGKSQMICQSRITKRNIPLEFCNYIFNCECSSNSDCGAGCTCDSSTCVPIQGPRETKTIKETKVNIYLLVFAIIVMIILPIVLIYLHDDYHWKISKTKFTIILILLVIAPLIYVLISVFVKRDKQVYAGSCKSTQCVKDTDCNNGSVCTDGLCVCPVPCGNKVCGTDTCNNNCGTCEGGQMCFLGTCINGSNSYNIENNNLYLSIDPDSGNIIMSSTPMKFLIQYNNGVFSLYNKDNNVYLVNNNGNLQPSNANNGGWTSNSNSNIIDSEGKYMISISSNSVELIDYSPSSDQGNVWNLS